MIDLSDLLGLKFGLWDVIEIDTTAKRRSHYWCICGGCGIKQSIQEFSTSWKD